MKKLTKELRRNWEYVHPILKFSYHAEKFTKAILKEIKLAFDPWEVFFKSL